MQTAVTANASFRLHPFLSVGCIYPQPPVAEIVCDALEAIETVLTDVEMVGHTERLPEGRFVEQRLSNRRAWIEQRCASKTSDIISGQPYENTKVHVTTVYHQPNHGYTRGALLVGLDRYRQEHRLDALIIELANRTAPLNCEGTPRESSILLKGYGSVRTTDGRLVNYFEYTIEQYPHLRSLLARIESENECSVVQRISPNTRIGWLNYWSAELAAEMGLDARRLKQGGFYELQKTEQGWYLRLTEEPLDIRRPEHAEILLRAYELLPVGRSTG